MSKEVSIDLRETANDKLISCLVGGSMPSAAQAKRIELLEAAYNFMKSGYTMSLVAKRLQEEHGVKANSTAYKIIRDAEDIFGELFTYSTDGKKHIYAENFKRLALKAEAKGDVATAGKLLEKAAKIEGAFDTLDAVEQGNDSWLKSTDLFEMSTDKNVLIEQQTKGEETGEIEDVEYEEKEKVIR